MKITPANIHFNEQGTPASTDFDDVYFSNENGIQETHYVFLQGNKLLERWQAHQQTHFCIAETGFGTGLNFFCTAKLFMQFINDNPQHKLQKLIFVSTEKHPIEKQQANEVLALWPQFSEFTDPWLQNYPIPTSGVHRRHFDCAITLDIHYSDATEAFNSIANKQQGLVDAWFLDGFAPSKNDSMWHNDLFLSMARISRNNASVATFTAAGFVKRGLIAAGFAMTKQKGFGKKREMLIGTYQRAAANMQNSTHSVQQFQPPYFMRYSASSASNKPELVSIVGNGLAGAISALKLVNEGIKVKLIWQGDEPGDGASGSPIGGFYPQLNAQNNHASRIQLSSFLYASGFYNELAKTSPFAHQWCGALQLGFNENTQVRLNKLIEKQLWPDQVAYSVCAHQASDIAGVAIEYPCLFMPQAGWISPLSLIKACINAANNTGLLSLMPNMKLSDYSCEPEGTVTLSLISSQTNKTDKQLAQEVKTNISTNVLILATGNGSQSITKGLVPLRLTRGQVEMVSSQGTLANLQTLLCHKGYLTPSVHGFHALGSTYVKQDTNCEVRSAETQQNYAMHKDSMQQVQWIKELDSMQQDPNNFARAAIRCSSPDHLPVVGAMPSESQFDELKDLYKALPWQHYPQPSSQKNVFLLTGLGSRGLTTAPLMAEALVSEILHRPIPLPSELLNAVSPNRFIVRALIRRQTLET